MKRHFLCRALTALALLAGLLALASVTVLAGCGDTVEGCTEALVAAWDRGDLRTTYPECDGLSAAEVDQAVGVTAQKLYW